jgi:hypothetical protein
LVDEHRHPEPPQVLDPDRVTGRRPRTAPDFRCRPPVADRTRLLAGDAKLARYRAVLDAGADPAVVAGWIVDTQAERQRAEHRAEHPCRTPRRWVR